MSGRSHWIVRRWAVGLVRLAPMARESLPRAPAILAVLFTALPLLAPSAIADEDALLAGRQPGARARQLPLEFPKDPPASPGLLGLRSAAAPVEVQVGPFRSVQVNVDAFGDNIVNDAANEPSIAISPVEPSQIVIGWRQFDSVLSNFREAGYAFSGDAGETWTFPGAVQEGFFRSDPVLSADADGNFYYYSLTFGNYPVLGTWVHLFKSLDGGMTWLPPVNAFGGDKQWMTIDRTDGIGRGNIYGSWSEFDTCCPPNDFSRSIDSGASFESPLAIPPPKMVWGTLDVGPDGTLYVAGANAYGRLHVVGRSSNAQNPLETPVFELVQQVNLGGESAWGGINPEGLLGQVWVATDHSGGPTHGNVYMLASVDPPGPDPVDVYFIRSTDGGEIWSDPIRVNDDPADSGAWQWFGTMSVAPNGRIDAIWNDTRNDPGNFLSEVFYSSSVDAGETWSTNQAITPPFDPSLGYPQQEKLGDYYHMISDDEGANLVYAATFNGEEDVYFLRIPATSTPPTPTPTPTPLPVGNVPMCKLRRGKQMTVLVPPTKVQRSLDKGLTMNECPNPTNGLVMCGSKRGKLTSVVVPHRRVQRSLDKGLTLGVCRAP